MRPLFLVKSLLVGHFPCVVVGMQQVVGAMNAAEQRPAREKIVAFVRLFTK